MIERFHMGRDDDCVRRCRTHCDGLEGVHDDQVSVPARAAGMGDNDIGVSFHGSCRQQADKAPYRQPNRSKARPPPQG